MTVTDKNTKAVILKAYKEAMKEIKALKAMQPARTGEAKKERKDLSLYEIANELDELGKTFAEVIERSVSNIGVKNQELMEIDQQIKLAREELELVHDIAAEADSLAALQYANEQEKDQQQTFLSERKAGFDEAMAEKKKAWAREAEEYEYEKTKARERDAEQAKLLKSDLEYALKSKQEEFDRSIHERVVALDAREAQCDKIEEAMDRLVDEHKEELAAKISQAFERAETSLRHELETKVKLLEQSNGSLKETITTLREENAELKDELKASAQMANTVAQEAVKSSKVIQLKEQA